MLLIKAKYYLELLRKFGNNFLSHCLYFHQLIVQSGSAKVVHPILKTDRPHCFLPEADPASIRLHRMVCWSNHFQVKRRGMHKTFKNRFQVSISSTFFGRVICTNFGAKNYEAGFQVWNFGAKNFVRKMLAINVDEIDYRIAAPKSAIRHWWLDCLFALGDLLE